MPSPRWAQWKGLFSDMLLLLGYGRHSKWADRRRSLFLFSLFFFSKKHTKNDQDQVNVCGSHHRFGNFFMIMAPPSADVDFIPRKKAEAEARCTSTKLCSKSEICHVKLRGNFLGEDLNPFFFIRRFINHVRKQPPPSSSGASGLSCITWWSCTFTILSQ